LPPRRALAIAAALSGVAAPAQAAERPVRSLAPDAERIAVSAVSLRVPLPEEAGANPAACDRIEHLRWRNAGGPRDPRRADAVVVLIPGFLGGAGSFDELARNTVEVARRRGRSIEVWALDRRANCLEDDRGVNAARRARDASVAYDYYWGGRAVRGRRFGGFVPPEEAGFLREVGLERTVRDWYAVLRAARLQPRRTICGGHSLGGPLTAAFASWDFRDGDAATTEDAGFAQCAGLVGLDTTVALDGSGGGGGGAGDLGGFAASGAPYVNVSPLTPETIQLPAVFGLGAFFAPEATDLLKELPSTPNIDLAQRALFSRDAANFATGEPSIRDFTTTNEVTLAGVFDDNSAPLSFLRSSVGFLGGGPVVQKNFPVPDPTLGLPGDPEAPLYRWGEYDEPLTDGGAPFTSRASEVSDLTALARTMFEAPANFIEQYFPVRILTDVGAASGGDRGGSLSGLKHDGPAQRPILLIQAGDSDDNDGPDAGRPAVSDAPPNDRPLSREITIPGYSHLDVLTAARRQNDGQPEHASRALAAFTLATTGAKPRMALRVRPRRVPAGGRVALRLRVRSAVRRCRGGVRVRRAVTDGRGRATMRLVTPSAGTVELVARKRGCRTARARLRVVR
jgi:hypothetical protein